MINLFDYDRYLESKTFEHMEPPEELCSICKEYKDSGCFDYSDNFTCNDCLDELKGDE